MTDHKHVGRMSREHLQYIKDNAATKSYVEIATDLNRDPKGIQKAMIKLGIQPSLSAKTYNILNVVRIEDKQFWPMLCKQFTADELEIFRFQWGKMVEQFKSDVLPTEELQMLDVIKLEILMNRNLDEQHKSRNELDKMEQEHRAELDLGENSNLVRCENLSHQIIALRTSQASLTKQFQELQNGKNNILKEMKATRSARQLSKASSRESFLAWMNDIVNDAEKRRELGIHMAKFRLATIDEEIRLAAWHKYEDGMVDQPLLTPETVKAQ